VKRLAFPYAAAGVRLSLTCLCLLLDSDRTYLPCSRNFGGARIIVCRTAQVRDVNTLLADFLVVVSYFVDGLILI